MSSIHLPSLNASLNGIAALFLILGLIFIKRNQTLAHKLSMSAAFVCSTLFLISYLYYHANHGSTSFQGTGWIRTVYFSILIPHTILAAVIVPMALVTVYRAWQGQFKRHAKLARYTWPLWMFVSVTGVMIYLMLYHL